MIIFKLKYSSDPIEEDSMRTLMLGIGWTHGICTSSKYSIVKENRDLSNTLVILNSVNDKF